MIDPYQRWLDEPFDDNERRCDMAMRQAEREWEDFSYAERFEYMLEGCGNTGNQLENALERLFENGNPADIKKVYENAMYSWIEWRACNIQVPEDEEDR